MASFAEAYCTDLNTSHRHSVHVITVPNHNFGHQLGTVIKKNRSWFTFTDILPVNLNTEASAVTAANGKTIQPSSFYD